MSWFFPTESPHANVLARQISLLVIMRMCMCDGIRYNISLRNIILVVVEQLVAALQPCNNINNFCISYCTDSLCNKHNLWAHDESTKLVPVFVAGASLFSAIIIVCIDSMG